MIKKKYNPFFDEEGLLLDDAYDPYKKAQYLKFFNNSMMGYIYCQDSDLRNLDGFKKIEYLTISNEAENYNYLVINSLLGMELSGFQLLNIPPEVRTNLRKLYIHCSKEIIDLTNYNNIIELKLDGFPGFKNQNLYFLSSMKLHRLAINSNYLNSLEGIESQLDLEELEIYSCPRLTSFSQLACLKKLKKLTVCSTKNLDLSFLFYLPPSVEYLAILGTEDSAKKCHIDSLEFLDKMKNLTEFVTNWKVNPNALNIKINNGVNIIIY